MPHTKMCAGWSLFFFSSSISLWNEHRRIIRWKRLTMHIFFFRFVFTYMYWVNGVHEMRNEYCHIAKIKYLMYLLSMCRFNRFLMNAQILNYYYYVQRVQSFFCNYFFSNLLAFFLFFCVLSLHKFPLNCLHLHFLLILEFRSFLIQFPFGVECKIIMAEEI